MGRKKKSEAQVDAELRSLGEVKRIGPYKGGDEPMLVECLVHPGKQEGRPAKEWLRGRPISCCKRQGGARLKSEDEVDALIAAHQKVKRLDPYQGVHTLIRFQCLTHPLYVERMTPGHAIEGRHLRCCSVPRAERNGLLEKARSAYLDRLKEHGRVELMPEQRYVNQDTPLLHRCLAHDRVLPGLPRTLSRGFGLRCCLVATSQAQADRRKVAAREDFDRKVALKGRVVRENIPDNDYIDIKTPLLFRCLEHDEVYPAVPGNIITGQGLLCCLRETWESESLSKFLEKPVHADSLCFLYLSWAFDGHYLKPGIARSLKSREDEHYGENLLLLEGSRAECWVVEQVVLRETLFAFDPEAPSWPGRTELRLARSLDSEELAHRMDELLAEASQLGWRAFAGKHHLPGAVLLS